MSELSICGAARLLAAIFGTTGHSVLRQWGILERGFCCDCGQKLGAYAKSFYCQKCQVKRNLVSVECAQCHYLFERRVCDVARKGNKHCFCSQRCLGKWAAEHYGFAVHPKERSRRAN